MTAKQFRAALKRLGYSAYAAAPSFGYGPRQMQNFAAGKPIPKLVADTLRWLDEGKITMEDLLR